MRSRQDIVLLIGLMDAANLQLSMIRWSLTFLVIMGAIGLWIALKAHHYL